MIQESPKQNLRQRMKNQIALIEENRRKQMAFDACANLRTTQPWRDARTLLVYMAFGDELSADPAVEAALAEGKSVFAPAIRDEELEFRAITSLSGPVSTGVFGIREPVESARCWDYSESTASALVLVPGLAFDKTGNRLGRGRGYYDRFIAETRCAARTSGELPPVFIGYAFADQVLASVPTDEHDEALNGLATEKVVTIF